MTTTTTQPPTVDVSDIYFTYISNRTPRWKGHVGIGRAKNATSQFRTWGDCWIYHIDEDNKFSVMYHIPKNTPSDKVPWKLEAPVEEKKETPDAHDGIEAIQKKIEVKLAELDALEKQLREYFE